MKANYQETVNSGLNILRDGLRPVFEKHWKQQWGNQWVGRVRQQIGGINPEKLQPDDIYFVLKGITATFGMLQHKGVDRMAISLARIAYEHRNECAHNDIVDIDRAIYILMGFKELLTTIGDRKRAEQIEELYNGLMLRKKEKHMRKGINRDTQSQFDYEALKSTIGYVEKGIREKLKETDHNRKELDEVLNGSLSVDHPLILGNFDEAERKKLGSIISARQQLENNLKIPRSEIARVVQTSLNFLYSIGQPEKAQHVKMISEKFGYATMTSSAANGSSVDQAVASVLEASEIIVSDEEDKVGATGGTPVSPTTSEPKSGDVGGEVVEVDGPVTDPSDSDADDVSQAGKPDKGRGELIGLLLRVGIPIAIVIFQTIHRRHQAKKQAEKPWWKRHRLPRVQVRIGR